MRKIVRCDDALTSANKRRIELLIGVLRKGQLQKMANPTILEYIVPADTQDG